MRTLRIRRIIAVSLFAAILACALVYLLNDSRRPSAAGLFGVAVKAVDGEEYIGSWCDANGDLFLFLPGYAQPDTAQIRLNTVTDVYIGGIKLAEGMSLADFEMSAAYELRYTEFGAEHRCSVTFMTSSGVPAMFIDTDSGTMEFINSSKDNSETGEVRLYSQAGSLEYSGSVASIKGRGNNTWKYFDKKAYSLDLSEDADIIDAGAAQRWILLANAHDISGLRDKIVYDYADAAGLAYSPSSDWVDLYLNGEYAGLYLVSERNEVHPERVDMPVDSTVLVSIDREPRLIEKNATYIKTDYGQALRIHNPKPAGEDDLSAIDSRMQSVENAILAPDGIDSVTGKHWRELIDMESWARKYLVEEIFCSYDACFISQYYYYDSSDPDSLVYAGPVWDFDISMGCPDCWQMQNPEILIADRKTVDAGFDNQWFHYLCADPVFSARVEELYAAEFLPLLELLLENGIDAYADSISAPSVMNSLRWGLNYDVHEQADIIIAYMEKRVAFLTDYWLNDTEYCRVRLEPVYGDAYSYYMVKKGSCLEWIAGFEDTDNLTFVGWYYADTGEDFDPTRPVTEDMTLRANWQDKANRKIEQLIKLAPLGIIACMGGLLAIAELVRLRRRCVK